MAHFSWKETTKSTPIAYDTHGKRILYTAENTDNQFGDDSMSFQDFQVSSLTGKRFPQRKMDLLARHLIKQVEPLDEDIKYLYEKAQEKKHKEITLKQGEFQSLPNLNGREVIYITAPSGAGKSTWVSKYAKNYHRMFPNRRIILFSRVQQDKVLDEVKGLKRIILNEELVENPIDIHQELRDALVILDDIDTIKDKKLREALNHLQDEILQVGRHSNTSVLITSHLSTNYKSTRIILAESHKFVIFPQCSSAHSLRYLLKNYIGLEKQEISKVLKMPSRWVCVHRNYPRYLIGERQAYLL